MNNSDHYSALPRCGMIARFGAGQDGIDKQKATAAGIHVVPVDPDRIKTFVSEGVTLFAAGIDSVFLRYGSETILKYSR